MRQEIIRGQVFPRYNGMEFKTQVEFLFPPMMLDAWLKGRTKTWTEWKGLERRVGRWRQVSFHSTPTRTFTRRMKSQVGLSQWQGCRRKLRVKRQWENMTLVVAKGRSTRSHITNSYYYNPKHENMTLHFTSRITEFGLRFGGFLKLNQVQIRKTQLQHTTTLFCSMWGTTLTCSKNGAKCSPSVSEGIDRISECGEWK